MEPFYEIRIWLIAPSRYLFHVPSLTQVLDALAVRFMPLSVSILLGAPNAVNRLNIASPIVSALVSAIGTTIGNLVKRSSTVRTYL